MMKYVNIELVSRSDIMLEKLEALITKITNKIGYKVNKMRVVKSNRPDLCDYQCDDVFKLSKEFHKNPMMIGEEIVRELNTLEDFDVYFKCVEFVKPGFINMTLSNTFINSNIKDLQNSSTLGIDRTIQPETFVLDYGGPNVAKPLHVGHMRTAIVGESIKRIIKYKGHKVISDIHLGDYGLQIGQVIYGIKQENKSLDDIDIAYLDYIYPKMSGLCKENSEIKEACAKITKELQDGNEEYNILWKKIMEVSVNDMKQTYDYLDVNFDYWYGESDAYSYLEETKKKLASKSLLTESEGALIVNVSKPDDKKEVPPLLFRKSNGAYLYASTDLATITQRVKDFNPDHILYVVDNRQALHFEQVFRTCDMAGLLAYNKLEYLGYGTVNGSDGKPYKTRNGTAPKLQNLFQQTKDILISKIDMKEQISDADIDKIVNSILKFADLQNNRERDYIFDISKFSEVTGKTGPYILYTYLRINKIISGLNDIKLGELSNNIYNDFDRDLRLKILELPVAFDMAFTNRMPSFIAEYLYDLCVLTNAFYQNNHINNEKDEIKKNDWVNILNITSKIIKEMLFLLVINIPDSM